MLLINVSNYYFKSLPSCKNTVICLYILEQKVKIRKTVPTTASYDFYLYLLSGVGKILQKEENQNQSLAQKKQRNSAGTIGFSLEIEVKTKKKGFRPNSRRKPLSCFFVVVVFFSNKISGFSATTGRNRNFFKTAKAET